MLKITVITVCFNAEKTIEKTISSVCGQVYPNVEYIIIDGASTDRTLAIVDQFASKIKKVISEKDKGIYDAMNKGVTAATGDVVYFLNADDHFCDEKVLSDVVKAFEEDGSRTLVYGKVKPEDVPDYYKPYLKEFFIVKTLDDFLKYTICHQAIFAKRSLFDNIGKFDCRYKFAADYDWQIRAYKFDPRGFYFLNRDICHFYYVGRSYQDLELTNRENSRVRFEHLFSAHFVWHYLRYDLIRGLKKKLLGEKY